MLQYGIKLPGNTLSVAALPYTRTTPSEFTPDELETEACLQEPEQ